MNPTLATQMLQYVQVSSALSKRALDALGAKQAEDAKADAQVAPLVDHMLKAGVLNETQKQAAAQMLASRDQALALLKNAVDLIVQTKGKHKQAADLGHPESGSSGSGSSDDAADPQRSLTSPFVGARTSEKKASDVAMLQGLGLPA